MERMNVETMEKDAARGILILPVIRGAFVLMKPEIVFLVVITVLTGFLLSSISGVDWRKCLLTLLGSGLSCAGVCALNQVIEWRRDLGMKRTARRPIPSGLISPLWGGIIGGILWSAGAAILSTSVSFGMAAGSILTGVLYLLVYIPLKSMTVFNTTIGAIPGALPVLGGDFAASGHTTVTGWTIFVILLLWQHPHFFAIAWMYREDYERGGFQMISKNDPAGKKTFFWIWMTSVALFVSGLALALVAKLGWVYAAGLFFLALWYFHSLRKAHRSLGLLETRNFLKTTAFYLQLQLALVAVDRWMMG